MSKTSLRGNIIINVYKKKNAFYNYSPSRYALPNKFSK